MFIITFKTLLNDKVGYQFCRMIQLFWLQQKVAHDTKDEIKKKLWIFLSEALATPRKMANDPYGGRDPQVENHCSTRTPLNL